MLLGARVVRHDDVCGNGEAKSSLGQSILEVSGTEHPRRYKHHTSITLEKCSPAGLRPCCVCDHATRGPGMAQIETGLLIATEN